MSLLQAVTDFCSRTGLEKTYWLAFSGGLDSHALLSLCHSLPINLRAIHIHHGLSPHADAWAAHCAQVCAAYGVDFIERRIALKQDAGDSLEELAREKRYAIFAEYVEAGDVLLTAHHQDDQAETLFLQLLRGAGPKGLAAMPVTKPFARGFHGRPLLAFTRSDLQQYAEQAALQWIEDESNANVKHTRNFLRHTIMPLLTSRFPAATTTIARTAKHCAEAQMLLEEYAQTLLAQVKIPNEDTLSVAKLLALDAAKQRLVLRTWIEEQGFSLPNEKKIASIVRDMLTAADDRMPCVHWQGVEVRRYRDALFVLPALQKSSAAEIIPWDFSQPLILPGVGVLQATLSDEGGLRADVKNISVRFRQGGEVLAVPLRGRLTLKNLFQEWGVPPWMRARLPLIFCEEQLIAVVGYVLDAAYVAKKGEKGWNICLLTHTPT